MVPASIPKDWSEALSNERNAPWFTELCAFVAEERMRATVYPPEPDVFAALVHTPLDRVKVVLVGQDPYHGPSQAEGLAFSVREGIKPPPSLVNMFKELAADVGCPVPGSGSLVPWAKQGVLLLNTVLTVRAGEANSHKGKGWERLTDAIIRVASARCAPSVFVLWGSHAKKKKALIDGAKHRVLEGVHPSPLSAHTGFFGSRPYSKINGMLSALGREPVDWPLR
ncbi:uracil-DNA glycosylase [Pendulispora albinea]|uniref:Uracil-DNA glycosylase n=1 Tax=Pendulispora albinea TaxID=2741071 RepID=A0ABZ2LP81_9BACT